MSQIAPGAVMQKRPRIKDANHLAFIRSLPCVVSLRSHDVEAAHVRFSDSNFDKPGTGMQEKPDDKWAMPLCARWHRTGNDAQHKGSERRFWETHNVNVLEVCEALYEVSGDIDAGKNIISKAKKGGFPWEK